MTFGNYSIRTHTHTYMRACLPLCVCVCVCVCKRPSLLFSSSRTSFSFTNIQSTFPQILYLMGSKIGWCFYAAFRDALWPSLSYSPTVLFLLPPSRFWQLKSVVHGLPQQQQRRYHQESCCLASQTLTCI